MIITICNRKNDFMNPYYFSPCKVCKVRWPIGSLTSAGLCPDCDIFYGKAPVIKG